MKRVLIMGCNDSSGGGLIIHYITLAKYLRKAGFDIACININNDGTFIFEDDEIPEITIAYQPIRIHDKLKKYFQLRKAVTFARQFKPDVFVATALGNGYAMIASHLPSPVFKIYQEVQIDVKPIPLRLKMLACFDAVAPQTEGIAEQFRRDIVTNRPVVSLPCFSKNFDGSDDTKSIPGTENGIGLAFFGRLAWNKGLKPFIEATGPLFSKCPELSLDIYGRGGEANSIQEEIDRQNLSGQITLKGFYTDEEFPLLISAYHGIIIPSIDSEGLPLILIEAMRFGRPVLATTIGAMPEVGLINTHGMIVTEPDKSGLQRALQSFIEKLTEREFDADVIHYVYKHHFSNDAFLQTWRLMLENPKRYFSKKQLAYG